MNDEAAESRGPSGPSQDVPAPSHADRTAAPSTSVRRPDPARPAGPPTADRTASPADRAGTAAVRPTGRTRSRPTRGRAPPPGRPSRGPPPPGPPPRPACRRAAGGASFSRDKLVRPRQGRYIAGVCAALGRATNTDPVLWRVLLAVLGFFGGIGVLLYLIGWLVIPAEGDTASPIESLLGQGRSGMAPLSVMLLGGRRGGHVRLHRQRRHAGQPARRPPWSSARSC